MLQAFLLWYVSKGCFKQQKGLRGREGILSTHVGIVETLKKIKIFLL